MNLCSYWRAVLAQDADGMRAFLAPDAVVRWPNTRERFTAEEFIRVNCAYPGAWKGGLERVEYAGDVAICVVLVQSRMMHSRCTQFLSCACTETGLFRSTNTGATTVPCRHGEKRCWAE